MRSKVLGVVAATLFLAGCNQPQVFYVPTTQQISFYLPSNFYTCPYAPASPGARATRAQRARYIQRLYYAWKRCYNNNRQVDRLYNQYRGRLARAARG
jgi:hypothetical protein